MPESNSSKLINVTHFICHWILCCGRSTNKSNYAFKLRFEGKNGKRNILRHHTSKGQETLSKSNLCLCSHAVQIHSNNITSYCSASSSFSDSTKLNDEERHTQPLKTSLNSRVPQNPTSARHTKKAKWGGPTEKKSCTIVIISPTDYAARQRSKTTREHRAMQTKLLCPPKTPATVPKLTLATIYNPPHTIRQGIKVTETYLYFLKSTENKRNRTIC